MVDDKKIEDKIDKIVDTLHSMDKTLMRNTLSLEEHMEQTRLLKQKQIQDHAVLLIEQKELEKTVATISTHVSNVEFAFKALKWIGVPLLVSAVGLILKAYLG